MYYIEFKILQSNYMIHPLPNECKLKNIKSNRNIICTEYEFEIIGASKFYSITDIWSDR